MKFTESRLSGLFVVEIEPRVDERGFFARSWCAREFSEHGLNARIVQCNISMNATAGTLRGMHFQRIPHEEAKLIRCTRGSLYDVAIDLRADSPTFLQWFGETLSAENRRMIYIPPGFAHGFVTLENETEVSYQMTEFYEPGAGCGVRWDDPLFGIRWPREPSVIAERDRSYPDAGEADFRGSPTV